MIVNNFLWDMEKAEQQSVYMEDKRFMQFDVLTVLQTCTL
jgi:hypothetical protein